MKAPENLRLHHIALKSANPMQLAKFYQEKLGLNLWEAQENPHSVWLQMGSTILMIEQSTSPKSSKEENGWHLIALHISPQYRSRWKDFLTENAIPILRESLYSLYFEDPEGNLLALCHYPDPKKNN